MENSTYLKFLNYEILKLNLEVSKIDKKEKEFDFKSLYKINPLKEDLTEIEVFQGIKIDPFDNFEYEVEVLLKGKFSININLDLEEKKKFIMQNTSAIMFPYIRSLISVITSQADGKTITLPTINFVNMMNDVNWEDILLV